MTLTPETEHSRDGALPANESRFEQPDIGPSGETAIRAHFGRKLQKLFSLPPENSEPADVRKLLRRIEAKLNGPPVRHER
jgi:hypothetical protein